jgi:RNA 3'-terminal phosphate cyclase (ATP)
MLELDGSGGGGQLVRTALACSALTGEPFRMTDVRGARPNPGLRPQHLAAVRAVAAACDAEATGAEEGSEEFEFDPGHVSGGEHEVAVGTAGSVPLVFDAVLPVAYALDAPLSIHATGGTDVKWAPTADHQRTVKLPLVRRAGLEAETSVERRGFYPAGGGRASLSLSPSDPRALELTERGPLRSVAVASVASRSLADREVAERQAEAAVEALESEDTLDPGVPVESTVEYAESTSPGSAVLLRVEYEGSLAGFDALGERGRPAEEVGETPVEAFAEFHAGDTGAAVDAHTADQLVLPLAVAGGTAVIPRVTDHVATNVDLLEAFGADVRIEEADGPPRIVSEGGFDLH